jgi:ubiquinol-cytochrome c reductase cytochrome b subunit
MSPGRAGGAAGIGDWLDARTGWRSIARWALDEPLPPGTGWLFTLGSVLLFLLATQALTGLALALYYAPTPDHAHDSVRFILSGVTFGRLVRDLHCFGASFIVVAATLHALRAFFFGAYRAPRELTWISGVLLLLLVLGFALTGYLLPFDQRAYWATVVTLNIARSTPIVGETVAGLLGGSGPPGAATLSRWYVLHVIVLPAVSVALVVGHVLLMRRHGLAGPIRHREGPAVPFYPRQALRDTIVVACVFVALMAFAIVGDAPLDAPADPSDAGYAPRPEWYFLWLFELLKRSPSSMDTVAALAVPLALALLVLLLPFLDRRATRPPARRPILGAAALFVVAGLAVLTGFGLADRPPTPTRWRARAIAGRTIAQREACVRCHRDGGIAHTFDRLRPSRDEAWIFSHVVDPEVIAPGIRTPPGPLLKSEAHAVVAWTRALRAGEPAPAMLPRDEHALSIIGAHCTPCHMIDDDGGAEGPNLSLVGRKHDADWISAWVADPLGVDPDAEMPAFADKLTAQQIRTVAEYLARRR